VTQILLDERSAAAALGITPRAMQEWRRRGTGPRFVRISRRCIRYRPEDLETWAAGQLVEQKGRTAASTPTVAAGTDS